MLLLVGWALQNAISEASSLSLEDVASKVHAFARRLPAYSCHLEEVHDYPSLPETGNSREFFAAHLPNQDYLSVSRRSTGSVHEENNLYTISTAKWNFRSFPQDDGHFSGISTIAPENFADVDPTGVRAMDSKGPINRLVQFPLGNLKHASVRTNAEEVTVTGRLDLITVQTSPYDHTRFDGAAQVTAILDRHSFQPKAWRVDLGNTGMIEYQLLRTQPICGVAVPAEWVIRRELHDCPGTRIPNPRWTEHFQVMGLTSNVDQALFNITPQDGFFGDSINGRAYWIENGASRELIPFQSTVRWRHNEQPVVFKGVVERETPTSVVFGPGDGLVSGL